MKLLSCYVSGFGRMENEEFHFDDGLNLYCQENGWGKTTLAVFIKAMFYGLEYSPRRKDLMERSHYLPWHATHYGGSISFEACGKRYRIERTFGKKDTEDTFALYDLATNLPSKDYTEKIGEELFGIDRDSFEKSVFVPQESLATVMTDSMNAKMGNLSTVRDDISNFDRAETMIDDAKKNYVRNSKNPGKLVKVRADIRACRENLERLPALSDAYEKQDELLSERCKKLYELQKSKAGIQEAIKEQSQKEQELGAYLEQKKRLQENLGKWSALQKLFSNGMPLEEEIQKKIDSERQLQLNEKLLQEKRDMLLPDEEAARLSSLFPEEVLSEERLAAFFKQADRLKELRIQGEHVKMSEENAAQLLELKYYFQKKDPSQEEVSLMQEEAVRLAVLQGQASDNAAMREKLQEEREETAREFHEKGIDRPGSTILVATLTLILVAGAVAFYSVSSGLFSYLMTGVCAVSAVLVFVIGMSIIGRRRKAAKSELQDLDDKITDMTHRMDEIRAMQNASENHLLDFLSNFLVSPTDSMQQMIAEIQRRSDLYHRLQEEERNLITVSSETLEELSDLQLTLYTALEPYAHAYGMDLYHDMNEAELLSRLKEDREAWLDNQKAAAEVAALSETVDKEKKELTDYLIQFVFEDPQNSILNRLNTVLLSLEQLGTLRQEIEDLEHSIVVFEDAHDVDEQTVSVEELQERQSDIDSEIAELSAFITSEREDLSELSETISNIEDQRNVLSNLLENEVEYEKKAELLTKTLSYLQKAREQFLSRYMAPLQAGLRKYLAKLYEDSDAALAVKNFTLDMDLSVHYTAAGQTYREEYLSAGYRDLVGLCARMALIDVLYRKEQPPVILDDPFTNLDQEKIDHGMKVLSDLAKERQILYFTCHQSRLP